MSGVYQSHSLRQRGTMELKQLSRGNHCPGLTPQKALHQMTSVQTHKVETSRETRGLRTTETEGGEQ